MITSGLRCANACFGNRAVTDSRSRVCGQLPLSPYPRGRRASGLLVIWNARQLLGQIQLVINKYVHTHTCDLRILQKGGERRLTGTKFVAGDASLKEFFAQAQAAD